MELVEEILSYWFGDSKDDLQVINRKKALWFGKNEQVDREIELRFGGLLTAVSGQGLLLPGNEPPKRRYLATIILLDQFPRNIYRGEPRCFSCDEYALQFALEALLKGYDRLLRPIERVFIYLPLEHSEQLEMQNRSVELFAELSRNVARRLRPAFSGFLDYALRHQDIIRRFGRFPHRNEILGRTSTAEEEEFLTQPNSSF